MIILDEREIQLHISVLGWLYMIGNAFVLLVGVFAFGLLPAIGAISGDPDATAILSLLGTAFGLLMVVLGLPGMLAGYGLLKRKSWARTLALVLGILNLVNFPLGTVMSLYTLVVLLQESATDYLSPQQPAS
jgi:hypothetical protein